MPKQKYIEIDGIFIPVNKAKKKRRSKKKKPQPQPNTSFLQIIGFLLVVFFVFLILYQVSQESIRLTSIGERQRTTLSKEEQRDKDRQERRQRRRNSTGFRAAKVDSIDGVPVGPFKRRNRGNSRN